MAIQALWAGGAESLKMTFLGRAALLGQFQHPNILRLEGVVTKSRPIMVLTELMELGPLDSFLRVSVSRVKEGSLGLRKAYNSHIFQKTALPLLLTNQSSLMVFILHFQAILIPKFVPNCPLEPMCVLQCTCPTDDLCPLSFSSGRVSSAACSWWPCSGVWLRPCSTCPALRLCIEHSLPGVCWSTATWCARWPDLATVLR